MTALGRMSGWVDNSTCAQIYVYLGLLSPTRIRLILLARFLDADPFLSRLPELLLRDMPDNTIYYHYLSWTDWAHHPWLAASLGEGQFRF